MLYMWCFGVLSDYTYNSYICNDITKLPQSRVVEEHLSAHCYGDIAIHYYIRQRLFCFYILLFNDFVNSN